MKNKSFPLLIIMICISGLTVIHAAEPIRALVSVAPQKYFVNQIGGDRVEVSVMVPPGSFPGAYEPKPRQMMDVTKAKIYFAIGVPFENAWLPRFQSANPEMKIVHTEKGIERKSISRHSHKKHESENGHDHEKHEKHEKGMPDPHIWLSPGLVKIQARNIAEALKKADPANPEIYEKNLKKFISEIDEINRSIRKKLSGIKGDREFLVFHPAWGYFADAYDLKQVPVEIEGDQPGPRELLEVISFARKRNIKAIFVQPQISSKAAQTVADAIDGEVITIDPLAENWKENLLEAADQLKSAIK